MKIGRDKRAAGTDWGRPSEVASGLQRGDSQAVEAVRQRVRRMIAFRGFRVPFDERADVEQESMAQIWRAANQPGFECSDGFWGFVDLVTTRRCIDWLRAFRETIPLDESKPSLDRGPLDQTLSREKRRQALAALSELDPGCRDLIYLHVAMEKSYREISALLGKSEGALRVQMHRCVAKIRRLLEVEPEASAAARDGRRERA